MSHIVCHLALWRDEAFKLIIEGKIKSTHELYNSMMSRFQVVASDVNHAKEEMLKHQKL